MKETKDKVAAFLAKHGMYHGDISMEQLCGIFLDEMRAGLTGTKSSLAMLPTYIETERQVPRNKPVIVMDAGGTNFRVATVCFKDQGEPEISAFRVFPMPGIKEEVGKDRFFGVMAGYIADIVNKSESIGFCFSYPIEMFPTKDGRVLYFSKEIKAPEVVGQMIGAGLNEAIGESTDADKKQIVLLNDTVATLLAGKADSTGRNFDSYIGFILGTGTNTSYVEQNKNIAKARDLDPAKAQIINVESGGFGKAPRGTVDKQLDADSASPGVNVFEKMISGAYLGPMCHATMRLAAEEGLLSKEGARKLTAVRETSTKEVSDFLSEPEGKSNPLAQALADAPHQDTAMLYYLIDALLERAAKMTAANLSSAAIKCEKGRDPSRPVCIVAEGTTFYHLMSLRQKVEYYLKQYLVDGQGVYYHIATVENATLIGAAIAGLTN